MPKWETDVARWPRSRIPKSAPKPSSFDHILQSGFVGGQALVSSEIGRDCVSMLFAHTANLQRSLSEWSPSGMDGIELMAIRSTNGREPSIGLFSDLQLTYKTQLPENNKTGY